MRGKAKIEKGYCKMVKMPNKKTKFRKKRLYQPTNTNTKSCFIWGKPETLVMSPNLVELFLKNVKMLEDETELALSTWEIYTTYTIADNEIYGFLEDQTCIVLSLEEKK
jgi:hypothetical protein